MHQKNYLISTLLLFTTVFFSCSNNKETILPISKYDILEIQDEYLPTKLNFDSTNSGYNISKMYNTIGKPKYDKTTNKLIKYGQFENFKYDKNGRLTKFDDISIEYNTNNNVIKLIESNSKYQQYFKFEYDENSNLKKIITSEEMYSLKGPEITIYSAEFDQTNNPYLEIPIETKIYLLSEGFFASSPNNFSPVYLFSKNNFKKIIDTNNQQTTITQQIISNFKNKPNQIVRTYNNLYGYTSDTLKVKYL